jgi:hypothetical protein
VICCVSIALSAAVILVILMHVCISNVYVYWILRDVSYQIQDAALDHNKS